MKIGIALFAYPIPLEEQILQMKKNGFETTFCGSTSPTLDLEMRRCREAGIEVENYHAPFGHINDIWRDIPEGEQMLGELLESVDNCDRYDVRTLVVHLSSGEHPPRINDHFGALRFDLGAQFLAFFNGLVIIGFDAFLEAVELVLQRL